MNELLSRKDAAKRLGMSLVTLDENRNSGKLTYIQSKPGGKVWISEDAIAEYLARATHHAHDKVKPVQSTYRKRRA